MNDRLSLRELLVGGDRRSVAMSEQARLSIQVEPKRIAELAALATDDDWLVVMRAMDLLEKLAHDHPDWVQPYRGLFIGPLSNSDKWEIRLQIVRALPLLHWNASERERVIEILKRDVDHPQKFVRAWALDSLAHFAKDSDVLRSIVLNHLRAFEESGSKALKVRAMHIRKQFTSRHSEQR